MDNRITAGMNELGPLIIESIKNKCDVKMTVKGHSMYPLFRNNHDKVLLSAVKEINKMDIVLFKRKSGEYVLHRVVKKSGDILGIAGDNEQNIEYPILSSQVIAVVKGFWRGDKFYSCKNLLYMMYSRFWLLIMPKRYKTVFLLKKLRRKLCGR